MMLKNATAGVALLLAAVSPSFAANADFSQCRDMFLSGQQPVLPNSSMTPRALCYSEFAVMHSGKTRTPIYVAQRLNRARVEAKVRRVGRYFADARLPHAERAELADYKNSRLDHGHMAPAGDMATDEAMVQSFSLANMVPQYRVNNQKSWRSIETATRKYVMRAAGDVYVISGPVFAANAPKIGPNQVWIPSYLFKLVYDPSTRRAWAHWHENSDSARVAQPIPYEELVRRTGIEFMPGLSKHDFIKSQGTSPGGLAPVTAKM